MDLYVASTELDKRIRLAETFQYEAERARTCT